jgi:hypothetical protein
VARRDNLETELAAEWKALDAAAQISALSKFVPATRFFALYQGTTLVVP